jgi:hypothetical protein
VLRARPAKDLKKGAGTDIDGYINFLDDKSGKPRQRGGAQSFSTSAAFAR